jgi:hypothetical protein
MAIHLYSMALNQPNLILRPMGYEFQQPFAAPPAAQEHLRLAQADY